MVQNKLNVPIPQSSRIRDKLFTGRILSLLIWGARASLVVSALFVIYFSLGPADPMSDVGWIPWDKAKHYLAYFGLTVIAVLVFAHLPSFVVAAAVFAFGVALELMQPVFGRTFSVFDAIANLSGIFSVLCIIAVAEIRLILRSKTAPMHANG